MTQKLSPLDLARRRARVLEMRKAGVSFSAIASMIDISRTTVVRDFKIALEEAACSKKITVTTERALDLQRLEAALLALAPKVRDGDLPSIDRWLRLCESRRRLLGLNKRQKGEDADRKQPTKTYIGLDVDKV